MRAIIAIVFIVAFIDFGNAINCYSCLTGCDDPFSGSGVQQEDCSTSSLNDNRYCLKTKGGGLVIRSCASIGSCLGGDGCISAGGAEQCCCSGNLCNSASTTGISYVTFASLIIAGLLGVM